MEQKALHQPFELYISDFTCWHERPLIYHFFEIVQVMEGTGTRTTNRNNFPYKKGSIFLFTPQDCRGFHVDTPTRFCSFRFSEVFLGQCRTPQEKERIMEWLRQLEYIFYNHNRFEGIMIKHPGDCSMVSSLMDHMIAEYENKQSYQQENLQHLVTLILNIIARNITPTTSTEQASEPLINRMLLHIRQHISDPEKLRIEYLAATFNLSANYVGEYFRKFAGESLQHYITSYKIRLVQQRLSNSVLTVSQIAGELGFTDESHLSRQFKKHSGVSPLEYRKKATGI